MGRGWMEKGPDRHRGGRKVERFERDHRRAHEAVRRERVERERGGVVRGEEDEGVPRTRGDVDEALERDEILRRGISPSDVSSDAINHVVVVQHRARDRTRALERFAECFHERRVMRQGSIRMPLGERRCDGLARECPRLAQLTWSARGLRPLADGNGKNVDDLTALLKERCRGHSDWYFSVDPFKKFGPWKLSEASWAYRVYPHQQEPQGFYA